MDTGNPRVEEVAAAIVDSAFRVHSTLGPALLESVYEQCLAYELRKRGLAFELQKAVPVIYEGLKFDCALRLDMVVDELVIVELKAVEMILPVHKAQLLSYLRLRQSARTSDQLPRSTNSRRHQTRDPLITRLRDFESLS